MLNPKIKLSSRNVFKRFLLHWKFDRLSGYSIKPMRDIDIWVKTTGYDPSLLID